MRCVFADDSRKLDVCERSTAAGILDPGSSSDWLLDCESNRFQQKWALLVRLHDHSGTESRVVNLSTTLRLLVLGPLPCMPFQADTSTTPTKVKN